MTQEILSIRLSADGLSFWTGDHAEGFGTDGMTIRPGRSEMVSADYPIPADPHCVGEAVREAVSGFRGILQARGIGMPSVKIVYIDTLSTVLVPSAVFDESEAAGYMRLHGIDQGENDYIVCSRPLHGTVAVMVAGKRHTASLGDVTGDFAVVSPLQYNLCARPAGRAGVAWDSGASGETIGEPVVDFSGNDGVDADDTVGTRNPAASRQVKVYATPLHCYITAVESGRMLYADVHPVSSAADLAFCLGWLVARLGFTEWTLTVAGHKGGELAALVSRRFEGCVCV
ncbi:MAG: DUF3822 family protein [Rikenellaceae bacterium]|nr:DUF3822 family protein [Rikenellaceae bacterium]